MNMTRFGLQIIFLSLLAVLLARAPHLHARPQPRNEDSAAARLFAYDPAMAFDLKEISAKKQSGVLVRDVTYAAYAPRHGRIKAYIVKPQKVGRFAGVVFFHWLGRSKSDRTQFLDEAIALASQGVLSILIQGYFPWLEPPTGAQADRQQVIDQTIEVRRALDLLLAQPEVDPKRIGYVGHDYGAMYGSIVAGLDKRVKAYVLIAGMGNFGDWSLKYWPATASQGADAYRQVMKEVDPIQYVSLAAPAKLLFQFSNNDKFIAKSVALEFFNAASQPKEIKWYDATHDLDLDAVRMDRREWLSEQLRLPKPTVAATRERTRVQSFAEVNGTRLSYEIVGEGPAVILIHGGLVDSRLWDDQMNEFSKKCRVIRYDLRGFGKSADASEPFSHIEDLRALLDFLKIERATIVGLSLGGIIAADFVLEYPERVDRLVLVGSGLRGDKQPQPKDSKLAWEAAQRGAEPFVEVAIRSDLYSAVRPGTVVYSRLRQMLLDNFKAISTFRPGFLKYPEPPTIERLGSINAPTLVVIGSRDAQNLKNIALLLAREIHHARMGVINGASHHPPVEKPKQFNKIVLNFIAAKDLRRHA